MSLSTLASREETHSGGSAVAPPSYSPNQENSLSVSILERIIDLCAEFEDRWHSGEAPRIEEYLAEERGPARSEQLAALLSVELELRFRSGETPDPASYLARFPEDAARVRGVFEEAENDAGRTVIDSVSHQSRIGKGRFSTSASSPPTGSAGPISHRLPPARTRRGEGWGDDFESTNDAGEPAGMGTPAPEAGTVRDRAREPGGDDRGGGADANADQTFVLAQAEVIDAVDHHERLDEESGAEESLASGLAVAESVRSIGRKRLRRPETYGPPSRKTGRFTLLRLIDSGMFGDVYLANDDVLHRKVALKFPRMGISVSSSRIDAFLIEARNAAQLDHPGIVRVYDIVERRGDGGGIFVVMQYVSGANLRDLLKVERFTPERVAALIADIADAAHYAHSNGFIHRDLKPANILIDEDGRPRVADLGLAVHERALGDHAGETAGTIPYMAPEQVRGASHRLDGRTDIWALGVILYEILTGTRPFPSERVKAFKKILYRNPRPLREIEPTVPAELERICLKCLSKRMGDRYATAAELADDLRRWLSGRAPSEFFQLMGGVATVGSGEHAATRSAIWSQLARAGPDQARIIPKGLRSFSPEDAPFFLDLMPGPRDRNAIPERARFWKTRIDSTDRELAFSVGLIHGPSGCGKSSMVQAGIVPRLAPHVLTVSISTTRDGTEVELLRRIRRRCPGLPGSLGLPESIRALREGTGLPPGKKLLIVLDQFEQWLQAHGGDCEDSPLVEGLRQCDGARVQVLILIRDDFWTALNRLFAQLEVGLSSERNMAAVDLFDRRHARAVLAAFGRGYGILPDDPEALDEDQGEFLDQAIDGLAEEGRVVCVRLALLAEMVKDRPWTPETLDEIGGVRGVGIAFLENAIGARPQHPVLRPHRDAARAILEALLPPAGLEINGCIRSTRELIEAAGYQDRPRDFESVLRVLDGELRLITATESGAKNGETPAVASTPPVAPPQPREPRYQLTHDYLIPSLREWVERRHLETRRGRALIRLRLLSNLWNERSQPRFLPSFLEWLSIRRHTHPSEWTPPERAMMRAANTRIFWSLVAVVGLIAVVSLVDWFHNHQG